MKASQSFLATLKEAPSDAEVISHKLMVRAGLIRKLSAGVYNYLPLGLKVIRKVENIIREEMNAAGGQELMMTTLQPKEIWEKTDRWDEKVVDVWFKSELQAGGEIGFGWSHEEPITNMMKSHITSYQSLPVYVHQFQNK